MPRAKKANTVIEIVALTGKPVKFQFTGDALDGNRVDIEYTEVACKNLLGCTKCTDGTSALDLAHLKSLLPRRAAMLDEQTSDPELRVRYTAEADGTLHIRAAREGSGKWRLELLAEMMQAT
jgi:hypothetical protein